MQIAFLMSESFGMNGVVTYCHHLEHGLKAMGHTVSRHILFGKTLPGWEAGWPPPKDIDIAYLAFPWIHRATAHKAGEVAARLAGYGSRVGVGVHWVGEIKLPLYQAIYEHADPDLCPVILPNRLGTARLIAPDLPWCVMPLPYTTFYPDGPKFKRAAEYAVFHSRIGLQKGAHTVLEAAKLGMPVQIWSSTVGDIYNHFHLKPIWPPKGIHSFPGFHPEGFDSCNPSSILPVLEGSNVGIEMSVQSIPDRGQIQYTDIENADCGLWAVKDAREVNAKNSEWKHGKNCLAVSTAQELHDVVCGLLKGTGGNPYNRTKVRREILAQHDAGAIAKRFVAAIIGRAGLKANRRTGFLR